MSPTRKRQISTAAKIASPFVVAALVWAAKAFAWQQVEPVEKRVTVLETQREADAALLKEVRSDVKELLKRTAPPAP